MTWTLPQLLSLASIVLFGLVIVFVVIALVRPLSRRLTRIVASTGALLLILLSINVGILYFWNLFWR